MSFIRFLVLMKIKMISLLYFRFDVAWFGPKPERRNWSDIRLAVILNHTSLLEPIFAAVLPVGFLWRIASRGMFPAADLTMNRPIAGRLFRILAPQVIALTRKRDESWQQFLDQIDPNAVMLFLPEGRMKRPNGLDKHGKPMTVRGGIVDVLQLLGHGKMLIAVSGGLHHLRFRKRLQLRLTTVDIAEYLKQFTRDGQLDGKAIISDLEQIRDEHSVLANKAP
ncbi:MAG: hypothetical protein FJ146_14280 [Deltaproteobacteria bacterium]|nr:hypothetical protein [Deltaproteobacteria bacterium]